MRPMDSLAMCYIMFAVAWFGFWGTLLSLEFSIYQIAIADASQKIALNYVQSRSKSFLLSRAFSISSRLTSVIFGPRLISMRAFTRGFALSLGVFAIALAVYVYGTPGAQDDFRQDFLIWDDGTNPLLPHALSVGATVLLTIVWLAFEYVYVIKSRWLIGFIKETTKWYTVVLALVLDVSSTVAVLSLLAPSLLIVFGYAFIGLAHSYMNESYIHFSGGDGGIFVSSDESAWFIYKRLFASEMHDFMSYVHLQFQEYYSLDIGTLLDKNCRFQYDATQEHARMTGCSGSVIYEDNVTFLLTTMSVSALATTIWMMFCATTLLIAKLVRGPGSILLWLHKNPMHLLSRGVIPTALVALAGGIIIPTFFLSCSP